MWVIEEQRQVAQGLGSANVRLREGRLEHDSPLEMLDGLPVRVGRALVVLESPRRYASYASTPTAGARFTMRSRSLFVSFDSSATVIRSATSLCTANTSVRSRSNVSAQIGASLATSMS